MFKFIKLLNNFLQMKIQNNTITAEDINTEKLFNCIKSIEEGSNKISTWSLSTLGGSLLAIMNKDFSHPETTKLKMIYLFFILGWVFIGLSFYNGKNIISRTIASELHKNDLKLLTIIFEKCNLYYSKQLRFFNLGLLTFGFWLLLYIIWWIFGNSNLFLILVV